MSGSGSSRKLEHWPCPQNTRIPAGERDGKGAGWVGQGLPPGGIVTFQAAGLAHVRGGAVEEATEPPT